MEASFSSSFLRFWLVFRRVFSSFSLADISWSISGVRSSDSVSSGLLGLFSLFSSWFSGGFGFSSSASFSFDWSGVSGAGSSRIWIGSTSCSGSSIGGGCSWGVVVRVVAGCFSEIFAAIYCAVRITVAIRSQVMGSIIAHLPCL